MKVLSPWNGATVKAVVLGKPRYQDFRERSVAMADQKVKHNEDLIPGDMIEFLWTESTGEDRYLWAQVEDIRNNGRQLTVAVYDDVSHAFEGDVPLFTVKWNDTEGRYEGKRHNK